MAVDQAQRRIDERLRAVGLGGRRALAERLRREGLARVWAAADRAGPMSELECAHFVLRRLYPELEGERLEALMRQLEAEWVAGTWTGFVRPEPPSD